MEVVATGLSAALRERGHTVSIICTDALGPLTDQVLGRNVAVRLAASDRWGSTLWPRRLRHAIRAATPDIVHIHNAPWLKGTWAARLARVPAVVHSFHGLPTRLSSRDRYLMRAGARMTDAVAAVSAPLADYAMQELGMPSAKIRVIPNGVDVARFPLNRAGALRPRLGLGAETLLVGLVARFDPVKDHATMLRAFATVAARVPAAHLVLVGDGELRTAIQAQVDQLGLQGRVHLLGIQRDMPSLLPELDLVTLSSRAEGLPMALLEAMAAGRCIVATAVGAIPELLSDQAGVTVPPGDHDTMAGAVLRLLNDAGMRAQVGTRARERVAARYGMDTMVSAFEAMYEWALARAHQRRRSAS